MSENSHTSTTFADALRFKYVEQEEFDNRLSLPKDKKISTKITFVGFEKVSNIQKQLYRLSSIDLSKKCIKSAGDIDKFRGCLSRVQLLNLNDNNLSWQETITIISQMPNLRELILSKNELDSHLHVDTHRDSIASRYLTSLTLGQIYLDWNSIVSILSTIWLKIDQLDLWDNHLNISNMRLELCDKLNSFTKSICSLKLSHNCFTNLDWISDIGLIDSLLELDVSNCKLETLELNSSTAQQLQKLEVLNVSYNNLNSWRSISSLQILKNLKCLICHENPIFISEKSARSLTIGRLGQIGTLNREEITKSMRRDSEIFYLRKTFTEYLTFKRGENSSFPSLHPRFEELVEFYGLPEDLNKKQVIDKYVCVVLCLNDKKVTKKLPSDMRIANLRMLCKKLFNLKPSCTIQITCNTDSQDNLISYILDKDGQTLHFFSVKNGHVLSIQEIK